MDKPTILYVDDEEINLFIFKSNFEDKFEVLTSASPVEALTYLSNHDNIEAVISDMRMPQMNGIEFITVANGKRPQIPYYILTAFDENEEINQAVNNGLIKECFKKPFDKRHVEMTIIQSFN